MFGESYLKIELEELNAPFLMNNARINKPGHEEKQTFLKTNY